MSQISVVIIKGNPYYVDIEQKNAAETFYLSIGEYLENLGCTVSFDKGIPYTSPPIADLWIAHSRGVDRLRFASSKTHTINLDSFEHFKAKEKQKNFLKYLRNEGIKKIADVPEKLRPFPPVEHYIFTQEMEDIIRIKIQVLRKS